MHPKGGDTQTRAEHVTQRGWPRLALDRRTIGLSALFAIIIVAAMVKAAYMAPPFSVGDAVMITAMILAGLASGGVMVWSWRTSMPAAPTLARRELMDAADVAAVMIVDGQGIIRHWSRGCEAIYGWPKALAIGRKRVELRIARRRCRPPNCGKPSKAAVRCPRRWSNATATVEN